MQFCILHVSALYASNDLCIIKLRPQQATVVAENHTYCVSLDSYLVFTARRYVQRGYTTLSRPSVCLSVCDVQVYTDLTGFWNTSKIILRLIRLRFWLGTSNGNIPIIQVKYGWRSVSGQKTCSISETSLARQDHARLLWRTNWKSHPRFRFAPKSMTLDGLKRPICTIAEKMRFTEPPQQESPAIAERTA